jgi:hypothetical protein
VKRLDDSKDPVWINACVYGKPGTGKTSLGVSAPKPLILLSESQGMVHVRQAAQRLGVEPPPTFLVESVDDYRAWLRALHGDKSKPLRVYDQYKGDDGKVERTLVAELTEWPETVVVDSLTDAARLVTEEIRRQSPPKKGKDGLPVDAQRFWQVLADRMKNLIMGFRDLPMHTLFLCLADDREVGEEDSKQRQLGPDLPMRRLPDLVAAAVNVIGYTYRREVREAGKPAKLAYGVMTVGPEYMLLKPYRPLRDVEVANFSKWVEIIHGQLAKLPAAPPPSHETTLTEELAPEAAPEPDETKKRKSAKKEVENA